MSNIRIELLPSENGGPDLVEIRRVGDPDTVLYKVSEKIEWLEEHFPLEVAAYKKNGGNISKIKIKPQGTDLTELKGVGPRRAKILIGQAIRAFRRQRE